MSIRPLALANAISSLAWGDLPTSLHVSNRTRAPAQTVYTSVISDNCTFLRGKCKMFPVIIGSCGCWREH